MYIYFERENPQGFSGYRNLPPLFFIGMGNENPSAQN
jgi:hypothetical protein